MIDILYDWNPWWEDKENISTLKGIERIGYLNTLMGLMEKRHVISISGIRRGGKTTLMYQTINRLMEDVAPRNICYINLDDERLTGSQDPLEQLFKEYRRNISSDPDQRIYMFLDEIQSIPGWERWIKRYYDLGRDIKFVVSGSSSSLISSDYSTLLTGRNLTLNVDPLSFREYLTFNSITPKNGTLETIWKKSRQDEDGLIQHLERYMKEGGFPEIVRGGKDPTLLKQYFKDIIYRDIIKRHNVRHPDKLELLAVYVLRNFSNIMSLRRIGQASGLSPDTVREYLGFLERSYMMFTSKNFSRSSSENLRSNAPIKIYSTDLGMANALMLEPMENRGRWAENLVAKKVEREQGHCFYWREKREVDIVLPERKLAMQVCYGSVRENEVENLRIFPYKDYRTMLISKDEISMSDPIQRAPLWAYLLS